MAADQITLSASEASTAIRKIKSQATTIKTNVDNLQRDVRAVKGWWKGDAPVAFVDEFDKSRKEFDKMIDCIDKYGDLLDKVIKNIQATDAENARLMRQG